MSDVILVSVLGSGQTLAHHNFKEHRTPPRFEPMYLETNWENK